MIAGLVCTLCKPQKNRLSGVDRSVGSDKSLAVEIFTAKLSMTGS